MADDKEAEERSDEKGERKDEQKKHRPDAEKPVEAKGKVEFSQSWPARIEEIIGRVGTRGDAQLVRCRILDGQDANKIIRRNVKGPVRVGDILMLRETEFEARKLKQGRH